MLILFSLTKLFNVKRKTDPFKVLILIVLFIILGLTLFNMTQYSELYQKISHTDLDTEYSIPVTHTHNDCDCGEYQIVLEDDGALVYDGDRFVGYLPFNDKCDFHKLMMKDND